MKLFVKILIGVSVVVVGILCYCLWVFFELSQDLKNNIKTQPMRDARWKNKKVPPIEEDEPPPDEEDKTIQGKSGDSEVNANDQSNNS